jgi:hypothetical protein
MTEAEWLGDEAGPMLDYLLPIPRASDRKLRLLSCGILRLLDGLPFEIQKAIECIEKGADGLLRWDEVGNRVRRLAFQLNISDLDSLPWTLLDGPADAVVGSLMHFDRANRSGCRRLPHLLRELFGNPFRPANFEAEWRTSTVLSLAKHIYESQDFSAMAILADSLADAGCSANDILDHCRNAPVSHYRGCFVLDWCLGKK